MKRVIYIALLWHNMFANAKEPELPPCPANIQYLPQNLPMHCRMPIRVDQKTQPFQLPPGFQVIQGMQSLPGMQMMAALPGPPAPQQVMAGPPPPPQLMQQFPAMPGLAAPMMPQKLPVVVMPYYSPVSTKKEPERRRHSRNGRRMYVSDETSDVDSNGSLSEEDARYNTRRHHREKRRKLKLKKQMLTPLLQYVTKDGYVIYEKKISNGEAKKWLSKDENNDDHNNEKDSQERHKELKNASINELMNKQKILRVRKMPKKAEKN
ncbi:uncharacterized protein LOC121740523 [Aricia agestis]|uniref:uncharacterized protein LOC121740523 n=1 Tax=Aricia agestis TaxID=91739 RepID=UPI001C204AED|nr:uncharacterized protein LOC121740523 [Aricia agestis]